MAEQPWEKRRNPDFVFDFGNLNQLFNDLVREFEASEMQGKPLVMGFNIKISGKGQPLIERFGNIQAEQGKPVVAGAREPLVDVTGSAKELTITAELPGVEEKDIAIECLDSKTVEIKVQGEKPFYKKIELDSAIKPGSAKTKFKNGVLEVGFEKEKAMEKLAEKK